MMGDHQSRRKRDKKKILISAEVWKIEVNEPTLESKSIDLLLATKDRDLDQRLALIDEAINMSIQGARSLLTSVQEQKRRSGLALATGYHCSGRQKFTN